MGKPRRREVRLSEAQQRLVRENLGLVAVHLRRHVPGLGAARLGREWQELFQEGCLGLIRAAVDFREQRGIAFAAFALPRIRHAICAALRARTSAGDEPSASIERCSPRQRRDHHPDAGAALAEGPDLDERECERTRPDGPLGETIGHRLHKKYERAVRSAAKSLIEGRLTGRGRIALIHRIVDERLLIPQEEARRSMRQIARETRSSLSRVCRCERLLREAVREMLAADPEFHELQAAARGEAVGVHRHIDRELERRLARSGAEEFIRRFRGAASDRRAGMLQDLLDVSLMQIEKIARRRFAGLPSDQRERLLRETGT